jgi:hypothetical protein
MAIFNERFEPIKIVGRKNFAQIAQLRCFATNPLTVTEVSKWQIHPCIYAFLWYYVNVTADAVPTIWILQGLPSLLAQAQLAGLPAKSSF